MPYLLDILQHHLMSLSSSLIATYFDCWDAGFKLFKVSKYIL